MPVNYDAVAWFYDRTASFIYGNALNKAEETFLKHIKPASRLLIAGGGTGKILEYLADHFTQGLHIHYVEVSSKMLARAKKRAYGAHTVIFTHAAVEDLPGAESYDYILTSFLFDNFEERAAFIIFNSLNTRLSASGYWINTDFQLTGPPWQKLMLKGMYLFFSLFTELKTSTLPAMPELFCRTGYSLCEEAIFYGNFIATRLYQKA